LYGAIRLIATRVPLAAAMIANYNPDRDPEDRTLRIAEHLAGMLIESCGLS
jgi:arginase family enzyme